MATKEYLDKTGLAYFWGKIKAALNGKNKTIAVWQTGNNTTFTLDVPCAAPSTSGFIHILSVYCYVDNQATAYICNWSKNGTTSTTNTTGNATTLTLTFNSVNETSGTVNLTFTFSKTVYGGIRVLEIC